MSRNILLKLVEHIMSKNIRTFWMKEGHKNGWLTQITCVNEYHGRELEP